jgi:hypothetical protein
MDQRRTRDTEMDGGETYSCNPEERERSSTIWWDNFLKYYSINPITKYNSQRKVCSELETIP